MSLVCTKCRRPIVGAKRSERCGRTVRFVRTCTHCGVRRSAKEWQDLSWLCKECGGSGFRERRETCNGTFMHWEEALLVWALVLEPGQQFTFQVLPGDLNLGDFAQELNALQNGEWEWECLPGDQGTEAIEGLSFLVRRIR